MPFCDRNGHFLSRVGLVLPSPPQQGYKSLFNEHPSFPAALHPHFPTLSTINPALCDTKLQIAQCPHERATLFMTWAFLSVTPSACFAFSSPVKLPLTFQVQGEGWSSSDVRLYCPRPGAVGLSFLCDSALVVDLSYCFMMFSSLSNRDWECFENTGWVLPPSSFLRV